MRLRCILGALADAIIHLADTLPCSSGLALDSVRVDRASVAGALERGLGYLGRMQRRDGSFRDFLLAPGASRGWITAHTAFVLENVPGARKICARAAGFLDRTGHIDGGWGYNHRVGNDSDCTAQALMVLQRNGRTPPRFAVDWLRGLQVKSGGFATYPADGNRRGWSSPHPDVTLLVLEALRRLNIDADSIVRGERWLSTKARDGLLGAYWWGDNAYAVWAQTRTGFSIRAAAAHAIHRLTTSSVAAPFDAMLLAAAAPSGAGEVLAPAVARLLATQLDDGSWPCGPCLRVTDPSELEAQSGARGHVYRGRRRVLSTAHATAALAAVSNVV